MSEENKELTARLAKSFKVDCCGVTEIGLVKNPWLTTVLDSEGGSDTLQIEAACVACGAIPDSPKRLSEESLLMLRGRTRLGSTGTWRELGLPSFRRIGQTIGHPDNIFKTKKSRRFHDTFDAMSEPNLTGRIRTLIGLPTNSWPDALFFPRCPHPIIVHHGLPIKFARKKDKDHVFLCSYLRDAITYPTEVWIGIHNERPHIRFIKKLATANEQFTLLVSVDARTSIVKTAFILDPTQFGVNRRGEFVYASWVAPE